MTAWCSMALLFSWAIAAPLAEGRRPCTRAEAEAAENATHVARRSWAELEAQHRKHARTVACDHPPVAEGWSEATWRLLARAWEDLPALASLTERDPGFLEFLGRQIDAPPRDPRLLARARGNAWGRCPSGYEGLCRRIALSAERALEAGVTSASASPTVADSPVVPCTSSHPQLVVLARDRQLWLCDSGRAVASYPVALGRGGTGKRAQGDRKTPLGSYSLGLPRPSSRFGTFIPIAYPTPEQRHQGYTGSAVGIHGPQRHSRRAGEANTWFDWTEGCIALGSDEEVQVVASWVRKLGPILTVR